MSEIEDIKVFPAPRWSTDWIYLAMGVERVKVLTSEWITEFWHASCRSRKRED